MARGKKWAASSNETHAGKPSDDHNFLNWKPELKLDMANDFKKIALVNVGVLSFSIITPTRGSLGILQTKRQRCSYFNFLYKIRLLLP